MEAWTDLYIELAERIESKIPEIKWVDLWHQQVSDPEFELPFPTPAVFIGLTTNNCDDLSLLIQQCELQVDFYLFFETFADTYQGAYNQSSAIDFLRLLTKLHTTFHGVSGINYQTMRRTDMRREDSGGAGNLYRISFSFNTVDASAQKEFDETQVNEIAIIRGESEPPVIDTDPLFILP